MSKREVYDCDRCGTKGIDPITLGIDVDRRMCPSGNGSETDTETVHICGKCAGDLLNTALPLTLPNYEAARKYLIQKFPFRKK